MRYLHKTPLSYIDHTENDRFIVSILRDDKVREKALMDEFGRISDKSYYDINKREQDEFYEAQPDAYSKFIMDKNENIIFVCEERNIVHPFRDGFAVLERKGAFRKFYLSSDGKLLGHQFKDVVGFANGLGVVELENGKFVMVDKNMEIKSPEFDFLFPFFNKDYTWAQLDGKTFVIDRNFNVVSYEITDKNGNKEPYHYIMEIDSNNIIHHFSPEKQDDARWSYVDVLGNKLGNNHRFINDFVEDVARVQDAEGTSFVNLQGEYITDKHFINCSDFSEGFVVVGKRADDGEHVYAFMRKDGTFLELDSDFLKQHPERSKIWFEFASDFSEGVGTVMIKGNLRHGVSKKGKVLKGKVRMGAFHSGYAAFENPIKKWSFVDRQFQPIKREFDGVLSFNGNFAVVHSGGRYDMLHTSQMMLSDISREVEKISKDPNHMLNLPDNYYLDDGLITKLIEIALEAAFERQDKQFFVKFKSFTDKIEQKIAEVKKIFS